MQRQWNIAKRHEKRKETTAKLRLNAKRNYKQLLYTIIQSNDYVTKKFITNTKKQKKLPLYKSIVNY